jgi:endonuclease G
MNKTIYAFKVINYKLTLYMKVFSLSWFLLLLVSSLPGQSEQDLLPQYSSAAVNHSHYFLGYDENHEQAAWVFYELTGDEALGGYKRKNNFREDPFIHTGSASLRDYKGSGYDRGHLAPAADMAFSADAMSRSFYMSNMSPQHPSFNRGIWKKLEALVRAWAQDDGNIYIATGGILTPFLSKIGPNQVSIPEHYYKVILDWDGNEIRSIAFILPNQKCSSPLSAYQCSIDEVELRTGIDFFGGLPDSLETTFEEKIVGTWDFSLSPESRASKKSRVPAPQCEGITQSGRQCLRKTRSASGFCWQHDGAENSLKSTAPPVKRSTATRCIAKTQKGTRCRRQTKNLSGRCWQHE